jgi:hypothetical protein
VCQDLIPTRTDQSVHLVLYHRSAFLAIRQEQFSTTFVPVATLWVEYVILVQLRGSVALTEAVGGAGGDGEDPDGQRAWLGGGDFKRFK